MPLIGASRTLCPSLICAGPGYEGGGPPQAPSASSVRPLGAALQLSSTTKIPPASLPEGLARGAQPGIDG